MVDLVAHVMDVVRRFVRPKFTHIQATTVDLFCRDSPGEGAASIAQTIPTHAVQGLMRLHWGREHFAVGIPPAWYQQLGPDTKTSRNLCEAEKRKVVAVLAFTEDLQENIHRQPKNRTELFVVLVGGDQWVRGALELAQSKCLHSPLLFADPFLDPSVLAPLKTASWARLVSFMFPSLRWILHVKHHVSQSCGKVPGLGSHPNVSIAHRVQQHGGGGRSVCPWCTHRCGMRCARAHMGCQTWKELRRGARGVERTRLRSLKGLCATKFCLPCGGWNVEFEDGLNLGFSARR